MPCRQEFMNIKSLRELLARYKDLEMVYVSIDEGKKRWETDMQSLKLSGYHLLASAKLINNIKEIIYGSKSILIPRYILLDPEGNVVDKDLPRPSELKMLRETLDEIFK
jgi:hypothetical protein